MFSTDDNATLRFLKVSWKSIFGILWPIVLLPLPLISGTTESKCGYVLLLMAGYFTLEPIPLAASALLPVFLFPLLGVLSTSRTCYQYMKDTIMMYLGGLLFAAAVEHSNLHKRIALKVLLSIGTSPRWILFGFSITTMFLSMWITNTATTAMMVPIVEAVVSELHKEFLQRQQLQKEKASHPQRQRVSVISISGLTSLPEEKSTLRSILMVHTIGDDKKEPFHQLEDEDVKTMLTSLQTALLLSLAFAANFGGTGTLIGSGPNLVLKAQMDELFPDYKDLTFSTWMMYNIPGMIIGTFLMWIFFLMLYVPCCKKSSEDSKADKQLVKGVIQRNYDELGSMSFHEIAVLSLFTLLVIAWLMREPQFTTGWADIFVYGSQIKDATAAVGISLFLFLIPSNARMWGHSPPLLDWKTAQAKIPWGVLILLGGGIALAEGAKESGLSTWISEQLEGLQSLSPDTIAIVLCLLTAGLTEFVSNMSMATILLPVVSQMALADKVHPLLYMLPVTIACSFAFMLPVGNPSNAIIFDSGSMGIMQMVKPGVVVKLLACGIELVMIQTLGASMFDLHTFPSWANNSIILFQVENQESTTVAIANNSLPWIHTR